MNKSIPQTVCATLIALGLVTSVPAIADDSALPTKPQKQSTETESVKTDVDNKSSDEALAKRKKILSEASTALSETKRALTALGEKKVSEAVEALEKAMGKLELILTRDPTLALAPIDTNVVTYDLLASLDTVKAIIHDAENYLEDGEIQKARPLIKNLASEIVFQTRSIPLATYPSAIKAVVPLIDEGKTEEARLALQNVLNTLVVTTDKIIPLPKIRAEHLLMKAEKLGEKDQRSNEENKRLKGLISEAKNQLKMAELLGYGTQDSYKPMYEQIESIEEKTRAGKSGKGWFDKIKSQVSKIF